MCEVDYFDVVKCILQSFHILAFFSFLTISILSFSLFILFILAFYNLCKRQKKYMQNEERLIVDATSPIHRHKTLHIANNKLIHLIEIKFYLIFILIQSSISFTIV